MNKKEETDKRITDRLTPNNQLVRQTKKELKAKGIKSPDVNKIPFWIIDPKSKCKYYFYTEGKFKTYLKRISKERSENEIKVSHPQFLCKKNTSSSAP